LLNGAGLGARLMRSTGFTVLGYGVSQVLRLGSNLVLTRLLYPEAFGLMTLVTVFTVGLTLLSDVGIGPSIQQSRLGDEPSFVDTAWTIQVLRGAILFALCLILGTLAARIYGDSRLETMLPVAGLALLISGFNPTRIETANRRLVLGRITLLDFLSQVLGLMATLILAWTLRSVWALVIGGVVSAAVRLAIMHLLLPGPRNRFHWDPGAAAELIAFGKWIFLSTLCAFLLAQGDKAVLGRYLSLEMLGVYNIGYALAGFAQALASTVMGRIMIPMYRERPPGDAPDNFAKIRRARFAMTGAVFAMQFTFAFAGVWLVGTLYDPRFAAAGGVAVAAACMNVPYLVGMTYDSSALAAGDSRGQFLLLLAKACGQTLLILLGTLIAGLPGMLIGVWLSQIIAHPVVIWLARRHQAWDPLHDAIFGGLGIVLTVLVLWLHYDSLKVLWTFVPPLG